MDHRSQENKAFRQFTCQVKGFSSFYKSIVDKMTVEQKKMLEDTPFAHLFQMPEFTMSTSLINEILAAFDVDSKCFKIGGQTVKFKTSDVGVALGLPDEGNKITIFDHTNKRKRTGNMRSHLSVTYFGEKSQYEYTYLKKKLQVLVGTDNSRDFVSLMILYAFTMVLFPKSSKQVELSMIPFVEDLEKLKSYCWATIVYESILGQLKDARERGTQKYLGGCMLAVVISFLEHCPIQKFCLRKGGRPRYYNWILKKTTPCDFNEIQFAEIVPVLHLSRKERKILEKGFKLKWLRDNGACGGKVVNEQASPLHPYGCMVVQVHASPVHASPIPPVIQKKYKRKRMRTSVLKNGRKEDKNLESGGMKEAGSGEEIDALLSPEYRASIYHELQTMISNLSSQLESFLPVSESNKGENSEEKGIQIANDDTRFVEPEAEFKWSHFETVLKVIKKMLCRAPSNELADDVGKIVDTKIIAGNYDFSHDESVVRFVKKVSQYTQLVRYTLFHGQI